MNTVDQPLRVIQWTTGNIGRRSLHAIIGRDDMELVGVYAHGEDKVGVDAAELAGWPKPTGVTATNDIDELIALKPDACCYNPLWPDIDELSRKERVRRRESLPEGQTAAEGRGEHALHVESQGCDGALGHAGGGAVDEEQNAREQTNTERHAHQRRKCATRVSHEVAPHVLKHRCNQTPA